MADVVRIAGVQFAPRLMDKEYNLSYCLKALSTASSQGARLVVFPECALTGYCFTSLSEAMSYGEPVPGPSTVALADACNQLGTYAIVGMLEEARGRLYNSAILVGPSGLLGSYRKVHLPYLGVDRFISAGDRPFKVYATEAGVLGMHICYDANFPESARIMALEGAEIVALPTNWPQGREKVPNFIVPTRALENRVHIVAVDRVGQERGFQFIGGSRIVDISGNTLAEASADREEIIYAEVNPSDARRKRLVFKEGEFELDPIHDRRPEFYGTLVEPPRPHPAP